MCGRFTLTVSSETIARQFELAEVPELEPRYNIAPTQPVPAVRLSRAADGRVLDLLHWGLIPSWAKDPGMGSRLINARVETAAEKPAFRAAFRKRRCLIVADGFYEWQARGSRKQPFWFRLEDGQPFAFAGLWERWRDPESDAAIDSCTILTGPANRLVSPVHDRMPIILRPDDYAAWLDTTGEDLDRLQALLRPYAPEEMVAVPVSQRVNSPANEGPELIAPLVE
jgi:putative SOS response-associated peptidase YedK